MHNQHQRYLFYLNKIVKVLKTTVVEGLTGNCGEVAQIDKDGIVVYCGKDAIKLLTVKPEGKGEMGASAYANGARIKKL